MGNLPSRGISIVMKVSILAGSIAAFASLIVGTLIVNGSADIVYENALNRLKYETNIKSLRLVSDINNLSGDTQYLVGTPPIQGIPRALNNAGIDPRDKSDIDEWKSRLATIFSELIRAKPNYLQIRYIGLEGNGKELVRVERSGSLIRTLPDNELQSKGDTKYFKEAVKINLGEVYLSDISLNREFGQVSEPHTPVIRAATPIYFEGKLFGILVINMEFSRIFEDLVRKTPRELIPYVTNEEGFFLAHPDRNKTYGFDLNTDFKIQETYPEFDLKKGGDLRDDEFTLNAGDDVVHVVKSYYDPTKADRFFAVMLATSYENLQSGSVQLRYKSFLIMALLVMISLVIAGFLASRLMGPLRLIYQASDDLANGREVSELPLDSGDEIGELARSFDDMRHQLEDKKRELIISQGRVHHANKMASMGEMAGGMAHEINSPVQAINFTAQRVQRQLKKDMSKQEINESMEKITTNVKKIADIIDSLRKLSRDSTHDEFIATKVKELTDDIMNMTEEKFRLKDIDFNVNYHGITGDNQLYCQRLQISQVLINLVNNAYDAVQHSKEKWIKIDIKKAFDKIQFVVTDSGPSIPADVLDKIFDPMFTTKEIGEGTGLGLSISREIVAQHNGLLYVDREEKNTCFVLALPVSQAT